MNENNFREAIRSLSSCVVYVFEKHQAVNEKEIIT